MNLALLLIAILPLAPVRTAHVDLVEHNTRCDEDGQPFLHQWIFWRWNARESRHEVAAWLADNGQVMRDGNTYIFHRYGVLYRVTADHRRVSVTQNDPERINAEVLPESRRKGWGNE